MNRTHVLLAFDVIDQMIDGGHQFSIYERSKKFSLQRKGIFYPIKLIHRVALIIAKRFIGNTTSDSARRDLHCLGFQIVTHKSDVF